MCTVTVTLRDKRQTIHQQIDQEITELLIAGLSGEPETIAELWRSTQRFSNHFATNQRAANWYPGIGSRISADNSQWLVIDLPGRLVVSQPQRTRGPARRMISVPQSATRSCDVPYHLSSAWEFIPISESWMTIAEERRRARWRQLSNNDRSVLYGAPLHEFILDRVRQVRQEAPSAQLSPESQLVKQFQSGWLDQPHPQLQGGTPHRVLLDHRMSIALDIEDRRQQWLKTGRLPQPIDPSTYLYRYGGIGPHEGIVYQLLLQHLIESIYLEEIDLANNGSGSVLELDCQTAIDRLSARQNRWLTQRQLEELDGFSPQQIINSERQRIPLARLPHHNQPVYQSLIGGDSVSAPWSGPIFVHLASWHEHDFTASQQRLSVQP